MGNRPQITSPEVERKEFPRRREKGERGADTARPSQRNSRPIFFIDEDIAHYLYSTLINSVIITKGTPLDKRVPIFFIFYSFNFLPL